MKKLLLVLCIVLVANFLHAQATLVVPQLQTQPHGFKSKIVRSNIPAMPSDTTIYFNFNNRSKNGLQQIQPAIDNMAVVGGGQVNLTLRGNNNQGFIVYSATPDNMPAIKPDATFHSAMPIVKGPSVNLLSKP